MVVRGCSQQGQPHSAHAGHALSLDPGSVDQGGCEQANRTVRLQSSILAVEGGRQKGAAGGTWQQDATRCFNPAGRRWIQHFTPISPVSCRAIDEKSHPDTGGGPSHWKTPHLSNSSGSSLATIEPLASKHSFTGFFGFPEAHIKDFRIETDIFFKVIRKKKKENENRPFFFDFRKNLECVFAFHCARPLMGPWPRTQPVSPPLRKLSPSGANVRQHTPPFLSTEIFERRVVLVTALHRCWNTT